MRYRSILEVREKNLERLHVAGTSATDTTDKLVVAAAIAEGLNKEIIDYGGGRSSPLKQTPKKKKAKDQASFGLLKSPMRSASAPPVRSPHPTPYSNSKAGR